MYEAKVTIRLESEPLASAAADSDAFARTYLAGVGSNESDPRLASFVVEGREVEATITIAADSVGSAAARALLVASHIVARVVGAHTVTAITVDVTPDGNGERSRPSGKFDGVVVSASGVVHDGEFHLMVMTDEEDFLFAIDNTSSARDLLSSVARLRPWIDTRERIRAVEEKKQP